MVNLGPIRNENRTMQVNSHIVMILKTVLRDKKIPKGFLLLALLVLVSGVLFPVQGIKYITITKWAKNGKKHCIINKIAKLKRMKNQCFFRIFRQKKTSTYEEFPLISLIFQKILVHCVTVSVLLPQ